MRLAWTVLVLASCGRISFEPVDVRGDGAVADVGDASHDAPDLACSPITCAGGVTTKTCNGRCLSYCDEVVSHDIAENRCIAWSGHLMAIHDGIDNACAMSMIPSQYAWIGYGQLIGSAQPDVNWLWLDGNQTPYTSWAVLSNEPQDFDGTENDQEDCAVSPMDGKWIDIGCASTHQILCAR